MFPPGQFEGWPKRVLVFVDPGLRHALAPLEELDAELLLETRTPESPEEFSRFVRDATPETLRAIVLRPMRGIPITDRLLLGTRPDLIIATVSKSTSHIRLSRDTQRVCFGVTGDGNAEAVAELTLRHAIDLVRRLPQHTAAYARERGEES